MAQLSLSGAQLLVADLYIAPGGAVMGEHYHPAIEERFTLLRGELGVRLSGRATKARPGVMLLVPPGVPHDWWNAGDEDAVVRVEIRPAARFEIMILNAFGLAQDGRVDRKGMPNFLQLVVFAREFSDVVRFTRPPRLLQRVFFGLVAPFARMLGYRGSYPEYLTVIMNTTSSRSGRLCRARESLSFPRCWRRRENRKTSRLAPDLNRVAPRSPYAALDEFPVCAAPLVDKCRAELLGQAGSYRFNCPMDRRFFEAAGLSAGPLRDLVATGADDQDVAGWMAAQAKVQRGFPSLVSAISSESALAAPRSGRLAAPTRWRPKARLAILCARRIHHPSEEQSSIQNDVWHRFHQRGGSFYARH